VPKLPSRITLIATGFSLAALAVAGRAAQLSLFQGAHWRARAAAQQTARVTLPARRGALYDRNGVALATSQESFGIGVAPREIDDPARAVELLARASGRPREELVAALRSRRSWVEWPGPYSWSDVAGLKGLRGVHLRRRLERFYPRPDLGARLVGRVDARGRGMSGMERAFDSLLSGRAGTAVMLKDARGRLYPSPSRPAAEPLDGADVVLTLDAELQEIAERTLAEAVRQARAAGGDVVVLQPRTGEVLALASERGGAAAGGAVGETFEPGSTAKVFTAAALLRVGKATPLDTVFAERGTWTIGARIIHDVHDAGTLSLTDVIRLSSNIGIAKLGARLTAVEQYEALRDFGFGSPTLIELPGESPGRLRSPRSWTGESQASLAIGYELAVTPLQLAAAYSVFANDGVLVEPTLLLEVRDADGRVRFRHASRPVRRVVAPEVAAQLAHMLRGVVEEGTGRRAALGSYAVAGKTGTARRSVGGRYIEGRYTASFVGLFPAVDPQLVLVVKIDDPAGAYFGGSTAAPLTREILEAVLATPAVAINRSRLSRRRAPEEARGEVAGGVRGSVVVAWPPAAPADTADGRRRTVPSVQGLSLREAARALHRSGFRVRVVGETGAASGATTPPAGATAPAGSLVVLHVGRPGAR
jgi:cell division protein FtsI (penicillin-binding protein 3)